jgi:hypothetical protein
VSELKKQFNIKRIARNKMHPEYKNDLIELLSAKLKRTSKGEKGSKKSAAEAPAEADGDDHDT